jgi:DNA-binding response OmpR family regulator
MKDNFKKNIRYILIVDDLVLNRKLYTKALHFKNLKIKSVSNGEAAIQAAQNSEFAIILLDVEMPGLNGFETAKRLRMTKKNANTPIIFITGQNDPDSLKKGYDAGAIDYLFKPVMLFVLKSKVKILLDLYTNSSIIKNQKKILEKKNKKLNEVLDEIKALKGLIPICSWCKKIKTEEGEWQQVEDFVQRISIADFTHGVCPECLAGLQEEIKNTK